MVFDVISKEDVVAKFKKAENKRLMIKILSELTASSEKEMADFLGVILIKKRPYVLTNENEV